MSLRALFAKQSLLLSFQTAITRAPVGHVVRRANHKTFMQIHEEIRTAQAGQTPSSKELPSWLRLLLLLPGPMKKLFNALVRIARRKDPAGMWVAMAGTVGVTAVGMCGNGAGWGLASSAHTLSLIVGGVARKPAIVDDHIEAREFLNLTVVFNHDVIDGAPATRFTRRLLELIESGYGLHEVQPIPVMGSPLTAVHDAHWFASNGLRGQIPPEPPHSTGFTC